MNQGCQLSNIEVTDGNIKSFEKCARKYSIDFSLKKDTSISPPRYFVFFKAKDVDVMTAAFKEYTGKSLGIFSIARRFASTGGIFSRIMLFNFPDNGTDFFSAAGFFFCLPLNAPAPVPSV